MGWKENLVRSSVIFRLSSQVSCTFRWTWHGQIIVHLMNHTSKEFPLFKTITNITFTIFRLVPKRNSLDNAIWEQKCDLIIFGWNLFVNKSVYRTLHCFESYFLLRRKTDLNFCSYILPTKFNCVAELVFRLDLQSWGAKNLLYLQNYGETI